MYRKIPIPKHKCIRRPKRSEILILRFLVFTGVVLVVQFVVWYLDDDHVGQPLLFWTLTLALGYKLLHIVYQWYNYIVMSVPKPPDLTRNWRVDMLTTYMPGEPKEMVIHTLRAMLQVQYPHTTYLCDEDDDPELKEVCRTLGVVHVYRGKEKTDAKAGNINYALRNFARGEIVVILDPDHIPVPEFIDRVLPFFEDPKVGFVQCIQAYYNRGESLIARGAAEQTYMFYGPMMLGMQHHGTVQAIGANCTFRRAALDSIGGHASGLCEDLHTSMQLHSQRWTSVYVPEMLTRGITPASISAYYHQQLKWSRGSFQLLFEVYPKLFRGFTWRQRIHYLLMPLYFLAGVITLIDIGVPIFSLLTYHVPLFIDFKEFAIRILPVLISISLVRHYVQRFILDQHEEGFHFMGGILRVGTWWVYLLGFIYSVFRVKVPYRPTTKANSVNNHWHASIPGLVMITLSFLAVFFGLQQDFTPYTWVMASFACINIFLLTFIVMISQQEALAQTRHYLAIGDLKIYRDFWFKIRHLVVYRLLRNSFFALILIFLTVGFSFRNFLGFGSEVHLSDLYPKGDKAAGMSFVSANKEELNEHSNHVITVFSVAEADSVFQEKVQMILSRVNGKKNTPFIKLVITRNVIDNGSVTAYASPSRLDTVVAAFREFQHPILLHPVFAAHESDPTVIKGYQMLKKMIQKGGAGNVSLVWRMDGRKEQRVPADIDLFLIDHRSQAGEMFFAKKRYQEKPVILIGEDDDDQTNSSTSLRQANDVNAPVLGWIPKSAIDISLSQSDSLLEKLAMSPRFGNKEKQTGKTVHPTSNITSGSIISRYGTTANVFQWYLTGNPYYVKGIVYNPEHSWRDGRWPLTRRRLKDDFTKIKAMGGNTISRDKPTVYDKNILQMAGEMDLHVIYGFSFPPEVDYLKDTIEVDRIKRETILQVHSLKDEKAILAWRIGAGTWETLSGHYHQPYLTEVRLAYMGMIRDLAKTLKDIDPLHPVLTGLVGDGDFRAALDDMEIALPYIDAVAVNSVYPEHLEYVQKTLDSWGVEIPYIVNEFGPKMNGQTPVLDYDDQARILEPSSYEKARAYSKLWKGIEKNAGHNLGGLAYCWRDRFEGTATFSGITDAKGRLKPSYFSLKESWTGEPQNFPLADLALKYETIFLNESINLVYSAMSANNLNKNLTYHWFVCREEYLERMYSLRVDYKSLPSLKFRVINEYNENIARTLHLPAGEPAIWYYPEKAKPLQRIYLYIYDDEGNVVTASYPIYSEGA